MNTSSLYQKKHTFTSMLIYPITLFIREISNYFYLKFIFLSIYILKFLKIVYNIFKDIPNKVYVRYIPFVFGLYPNDPLRR